MLRLLLIGGILLALAGGLIYWRFFKSNSEVVSPSLEQSIQTPKSSPIEVPKTLSGASLDDKVKSLQDSLAKVIDEINKIKSSSSNQILDTRLKAVETAVTDLKVRVTSLEKGSSSTTTKSSTGYIPLGAGGSAGDRDWLTINNYQISIDPAEYPGYSSMQLEVNFRLTQKSGTAYARLYNLTSSSATSSEVSTTSDTLGWQTSSTFQLASGQKSYALQVKSSEGVDMQLGSARIKVNY